MSKCETKEELKKVWDQLEQMKQEEVIQLSNPVVQIQNNNERARVQQKMDHAIGCMTIVYLFSFLEHHDFDLSNQWLEPAEKRMLKAWKHLRHSAGHGFNGERANRYADVFDDVVQENNSIKNLVTINNDNTFNVESTIGFRFLNELCEIIKHLFVRAVQSGS